MSSFFICVGGAACCAPAASHVDVIASAGFVLVQYFVAAAF